MRGVRTAHNCPMCGSKLYYHRLDDEEEVDAFECEDCDSAFEAERDGGNLIVGAEL